MPKRPTPSLPDLLLALRVEHGLTLAQLAEQVGVSRQALSAIETGKRRGHRVTRAKIVALLRRNGYYYYPEKP